MDQAAADKVKQIRDRREGICDDCGCEYVTPWFAANPLWNRVIPDRQGMLCPNCFTQRARKAGIDTSWELREETFPPPPSATTKQWLDAQPSNGRMHEHLGLYWIPYEDVPEILDRHALSQLSASEERVRDSFNEGILAAANRLGELMLHSPKHDRELLINAVLELRREQ